MNKFTSTKENFKRDIDVINLLSKTKNHKWIPYIKDINSFVYRFNIQNCDFLLKSFLTPLNDASNNSSLLYVNIVKKCKKGLLRQIYRFIHLRPSIIKYARKIIMMEYEYEQFIFKCLLKTMSIIPYINIKKSIIHKILDLKENKVNEFIYSNIPNKSNLITDTLILNNINKYPRLIYLCSEKMLRNVNYIKKILHKVKYMEYKYEIVLNYLFDNNIPIVFNHQIIEMIYSIDCRYLSTYVEDYNLNLNANLYLFKKLLYRCSCCCMKYYNLNYKNVELIFELIKISINVLDYIDFEQIENKEDFLYTCCDINIYCIPYFIKNYNITLEMYQNILDINHNIINFIEDENTKNKLIIYYYKNNYFLHGISEYHQDKDLIDIKNFHIATYKKKDIPIEIKKNIYSYLYNIE